MKKKIGILGGIAPPSTVEYYKLIIEKYFEEKNDYDYPEIIIYSLNLKKIIELQSQRPFDKEKYVREMMKGINALKSAGADFVIIASNASHIVFDKLERISPLFLLSIVKATLEKAKENNLKRLLLLGIGLTMQSYFYPNEFKKEGIEIIVPTKAEQNIIEKIIFEEVDRNIIKKESKEKILKIIKKYKKYIDGVILGCTELPLIVKQGDIGLKLLNTTEIHTNTALKFSQGLKPGFSP